MPERDKQLIHIDVQDGCIRISVGVGLLAFAVQAAEESGWPRDYKIVDPEVFAREVIRVLTSEEEDGTTPVHRMLDAAAIEALEQGADGCLEGDPIDGLVVAKTYMEALDSLAQ